MKKILVITVAIMLLLSVFISCGRNNAETTVIYTPGTFPDDYVNDAYAPVVGKHYQDGYYHSKSKLEFFDKKLSDKTVELFGKKYKLKYDETVKPQFSTCAIDYYDAYDSSGNKKDFYVIYLSGTDKILGATCYGEANFEEIKKGKIKTEDEFLSYAKEIAGRYIDLTEYDIVASERGNGIWFYFYKLLDGYRTREYIRIIIKEDGSWGGIEVFCYNSFKSFKNIKFNKQAIEYYAYGNKIESVTIMNDDGDLVAEIKYWKTRLVDTTTAADGSPLPTETVLLTRYVPLTKQSSASKVTTAKVTTAAPITTLPPDTGSYCTTAPENPILKPQE